MQAKDNSLEFVRAKAEEMHIVRWIAQNTWPSTFGDVLPSAQIDYMLDMIYHDTSLSRQLSAGHVFILARLKGEAVGFASYEANYQSISQLMIHKLYLLPSAQGLGIGMRFLHVLSEIATRIGNKQLRLKVFHLNAKAIGFYESQGFVRVGTEASQIGNGYQIVDDVMIKDL